MTKPIQDIIDGLEHTKSETEEYIRPLHASKIQDAIDALKAMRWRDVSEMHDEQDVILMGGNLVGEIHIDEPNKDGCIANYNSYNGGEWQIIHSDAYEVLCQNPTHFIPLSSLGKPD